MTGELEFSQGVRKRGDRNRTSGTTDVNELETETLFTEKVDRADKMSETFASRTGSFSSESAKPEENSDDARAASLRAAIRSTLRRDELLRRERKKKVPQICVSVLGMVCLGWPSLLLFDLVLAFLPFDHVEALQYSSQETSFVGVASRLCLKIVKFARNAQITNKEYHGVITFACLVFLAFLLYLVRVTTKTQKALTYAERQMLKEMMRELGNAHPSDVKQNTDQETSLE